MDMTATYSPEDNKLRLYSASRLTTETYARVKSAGFIWAPKQELFVAPMWTPGRADLLTELCGEIGDEDTSLVDRASERAERFGDYSEARAVELTSAQYAAINQDYKGTRVVGNSHRVRTALVKSSLVCVFLTDSKVHSIPEPIERSTRVELRDPRPLSQYTAPDPTKFDALKETLKSGVKVVSAPQLFPTPKELARRMIELAEIKPGETVLEPSTGTGAIVREIIAAVDTEIVGYDINAAIVSNLTVTFPSYRLQARCRDFLEVTDGMGNFPVVLMNPPFADGQDIAHIRHAMKFLRPGGRLVAICANGSRQQAKLKPIMDTWEDLPPGTFEESGTGVNAALVTYTAPEGVQS